VAGRFPVVRFDAGPADVAEGELRSVPVDAEHVVLVSCVAGAMVALDDRCNHAGCLLSKGWVEDRAVVCPCHEYAFDLASGANTSVWRLCGDQDRYAVEVEGGRVLVSGPIASGR
jgi:3-phenylpropionate/trans-cinnamate dioxygenase ferredoxin subunit